MHPANQNGNPIVQLGPSRWQDRGSTRRLGIAECRPVRPCRLPVGGSREQEIISVGMVRLIATPKRYANKVVRVSGLLCVEEEHTAMYLSAFDARHHVFGNALWVSGPSVRWDDRTALNQEAVTLEGRFDPRERGYLDMFGNGGLRGVNWIVVLRG